MIARILAPLRRRLKMLVAPAALPPVHPSAKHCSSDTDGTNYVASKMFVLTGTADVPNGAWCWFQDPRALVDLTTAEAPMLVVSSVSTTQNAHGLPRGANDILMMPLEGGEVIRQRLNTSLTRDDHNAAALHQKADGRIIAIYADHGHETQSYGAISSAQDFREWSALSSVTHRARVSYSNLFRTGQGALFNFTRSVGWNPNFLVTEDEGECWTYGGRLIKGEGRPYVQYAQGDGCVHFITTEQHPRDFPNSIYHGVFDGDRVLASDGKVISDNVARADGVAPDQLTKIFHGTPDQAAWTVDVIVGANGQPVVLFSTRNGDAETAPEKQGMDLRYHYARFDGAEWQVHDLAHAGTRLYAAEADYSGLAAIDPQDPDKVVISTNSDPVSGEPLISAADGRRHWELFQGRTRDGGAAWAWTPLTSNSKLDNIRPIIPSWPDGRRVILWMRGTYRTYKDWNTQIVGIQRER